MSVAEVIPTIATYIPFEIIEKYYQFKLSELISPDDAGTEKESYYIISYALDESASNAYYSGEHEYSGSIDIIIETDRDGVVHNFRIDFGTPRWMSSLSQNGFHIEEWECDIRDYKPT